ncbi:low affinity immunoglobulin epsilon Fc receptor-like isoform X2 [Sceloporus undulatus]|nr:low affinity immunoglobulin epsilon Fc receptor-like isoform X2 [Sceloporus undulatus]
MISKYSEMAKEFEQLHNNQTLLTASGARMEKQLAGLHSDHSKDGSRLTEQLKKLEAKQDTMKKEVYKHLTDLDAAEERIQEDTFKLQEALYKMNVSACRVCPEGWLLNRGSCYLFQKMNQHWSFAQKSCTDEDSSLVVINDAEEQSFLTLHSEKKIYWIGLSDMNSESTFTWVDYTSTSYTHWNPREPNNAGRGQDCVVMTGTGWWDDIECGGNADGWICEQAWKC